SKKWIPQIWPNAKFNESKSFWAWPTGERLYFRQFNKPDDYWNYHGHAYPWVGWEELCNWPVDDGYKRMFSCVRSSNPEVAKRTRVRSTTNPY
ncbi:terminase, partial [Xanthomonas citri pv. citri]|nr:terminase [Xanthomonas citri pv. citri]